jgi:hypothetical protein
MARKELKFFDVSEERTPSICRVEEATNKKVANEGDNFTEI